MPGNIDLTLDVYTKSAVAAAVRAFDTHIQVAVQDRLEFLTVSFGDVEARIIDEFLNYALTLSAQEHLS